MPSPPAPVTDSAPPSPPLPLVRNSGAFPADISGFDWQAVRLDIANAVRRTLPPKPFPQHLAAAAGAVRERAGAWLQRYGRRPSLVACGPGCGHCCVVNVATLEPEGWAIGEYLERNLEAEQRSRLRERLAELVATTRWLDDEERLMLRRPCAFLDERDRCLIHPVRPLLCRKVTSLDPEVCREAVAMHAFGEVVPIMADLFQDRLYAEVFKGFAEGLGALGLASRSTRLCEQVLLRVNALTEESPPRH